ncbi:MAG: alcohol dehydrogenase catalytic domain-containing protein [Candidatus Tectomicrobia bacterium]|uniref:Alcohol dehydrogenase catalytic domain-containing protein n=1 Tax=Tectimicrobiota bacterium TaxID=2528274 RepID=A0A932HWP5_UNCTE|nr:alcohol dehydrogenase catalytic domain-containing protein [Candidatus Tectomicrobia bacterium]
MQAAWLESPKKMTVVPKEDPGLPPDHVLVRVATTAICGTDISIWQGKMAARLPLIPGHECTGTVEELGKAVTRLKRGDRVVINPVTTCGSCHYCVRGFTNLCLRGGLRGREVAGTFAEYVSVKETDAFPFPDKVSFAAATNFVGLYTVVYSQRKAPYIPGGRVAVLGAGSTGLLHIQLARAAGAGSIIAVTRSQWKLDMAKKLGADHLVRAGAGDPVQAVKDLTDGLGAEVVIETAGAAETMRQAYGMVRPGGVILQFGIGPKAVDGIPGQDYYFKDITVIGSRAGLAEDFERAVRLVASGRIDLEPLVTHRFPLRDIQRGFEFIEKGGDGGTLRAVIEVGK